MERWNSGRVGDGKNLNDAHLHMPGTSGCTGIEGLTGLHNEEDASTIPGLFEPKPFHPNNEPNQSAFSQTNARTQFFLSRVTPVMLTPNVHAQTSTSAYSGFTIDPDRLLPKETINSDAQNLHEAFSRIKIVAKAAGVNNTDPREPQKPVNNTHTSHSKKKLTEPQKKKLAHELNEKFPKNRYPTEKERVESIFSSDRNAKVPVISLLTGVKTEILYRWQKKFKTPDVNRLTSVQKKIDKRARELNIKFPKNKYPTEKERMESILRWNINENVAANVAAIAALTGYAPSTIYQRRTVIQIEMSESTSKPPVITTDQNRVLGANSWLHVNPPPHYAIKHRKNNNLLTLERAPQTQVSACDDSLFTQNSQNINRFSGIDNEVLCNAILLNAEVNPVYTQNEVNDVINKLYLWQNASDKRFNVNKEEEKQRIKKRVAALLIILKNKAPDAKMSDESIKKLLRIVFSHYSYNDKSAPGNVNQALLFEAILEFSQHNTPEIKTFIHTPFHQYITETPMGCINDFLKKQHTFTDPKLEVAFTHLQLQLRIKALQAQTNVRNVMTRVGQGVLAAASMAGSALNALCPEPSNHSCDNQGRNTFWEEVGDTQRQLNEPYEIAREQEKQARNQQIRINQEIMDNQSHRSWLTAEPYPTFKIPPRETRKVQENIMPEPDLPPHPDDAMSLSKYPFPEIPPDTRSLFESRFPEVPPDTASMINVWLPEVPETPVGSSMEQYYCQVKATGQPVKLRLAEGINEKGNPFTQLQ